MCFATKRNCNHAEAGGITILVALMLLVLLTIAAVGMSRNSFREIVTSGFSRQGAMARNTADSGVEWAVHWIEIENSNVATGVPAQFRNQRAVLRSNELLQGFAKDALTGADYSANAAPAADFTLAGSPDGVVQGFTLGLTLMGKGSASNTSQGITQGSFAPASGSTQALKVLPDLWAVRSDAQVQQGATTFIHAREAWITTPVQ